MHSPHILARLAALAGALLAVVVLAGCGDTTSDRRAGSGAASLGGMRLALDYVPNADHVALYWAKERGLFDERGLDVQPLPPADASAPLKLLSADKVDLAISYEPEVLLAAGEGLNLTAVGWLVPVPLVSLIAKPDGPIQDAADLAGHSIGWPGIPYDGAMIDAVLEQAGIADSEVERVNVGFNLVPALASGKVDALIGGFRNTEAVQVEERIGAKPVVIPVDELGVPTYDELVFVANRERLASEPQYREQVRAFLAAYYEALEQASADVDASIDLLHPIMKGSRRDAEESVRVTLPLMEVPDGEPAGCIDPAEWDTFSSWMADGGLLSEPVKAQDLVSNDLLPEACA